MKKIFVYLIACAIVPFIITSCNKEGGNGETQGKIIKNAVKDKDGNKYDAVKIGDQVWMAENLRTTKYADGTSIPMGESGSKGSGKRYYPGGKASNVEKYGYLYDWEAVMHGQASSESTPSGVQGICPKGWHVPSEAEWQDMINYVAYQIETGELQNTTVAKALASTEGWEVSSSSGTPGFVPSANNSTGFSAVPAGEYFFGYNQFHEYVNDYGLFGRGAIFWSATMKGESRHSAEYRFILYDYKSVTYNYDRFSNFGGNTDGYSVRCLRD